MSWVLHLAEDHAARCDCADLYPYLLGCGGCGKGMRADEMRRLPPPRPVAADCLTILPIVCAACARLAGAA